MRMLALLLSTTLFCMAHAASLTLVTPVLPMTQSGAPMQLEDAPPGGCQYSGTLQISRMQPKDHLARLMADSGIFGIERTVVLVSRKCGGANESVAGAAVLDPAHTFVDLAGAMVAGYDKGEVLNLVSAGVQL